MNEAKFTKGEWVARTEKFGGLQIAVVYMNGGGFTVSGAPDSIANAYLIAAAPEMYKMLADIVEDAKSYESRSGKLPTWAVRADKLLAKARGEL